MFPCVFTLLSARCCGNEVFVVFMVCVLSGYSSGAWMQLPELGE